MTQIVDEVSEVLAKLQTQLWWQGSLIHINDMGDLTASHPECEWWIMATQPCNIYSDDFDAVPVVELIGASSISELGPASSGFHPRQIHLSASSGSGELLLQADSQKRVWIPRRRLLDLPSPAFRLENHHAQPVNTQALWLDKFSSWLSRGYTRAALPDAFNRILAVSKVRDVLEAKLAKKKHDELYGIFLTITAEDQEQTAEIGLLEPPYDLGILVACYEDADPDNLKDQLIRQLFEDQVKDPDVESLTITRSALARRLGLRMIKADLEVRSISNIRLSELLGKNVVRYNLVDFHSAADSSAM